MARRAAPLPKVMFRCREAGRQANPSTRRKPRLQVRKAGRHALAATFGGMDAADEPTWTYSRRVADSAWRPASRDTINQSANPRSSSFTLVLPRVFSSTCLTITAQYSEWLPSAAGSEPDTTTL